MVTAGTYRGQNFLDSHEKLNMVRGQLFSLADEFDWRLQAWAIMGNHYHFVALSPTDPSSLKTVIQRLHSISARKINEMDGIKGRKIWQQYWDSHINFERSYFARLNYVHNNPVHHGLVKVAHQYDWCSATWFELNAKRSFVNTIKSFKTDRLNVKDDF